VSRPQRERSPAFRPDTCLTRTFLLHVLRPPEPADDDDKDGTVLSAREPRRSRSAAVAPSETSGTREPSEKALSEQSLEHPDERQVGLDTDRSFVLYPVGKATIPAFDEYRSGSECALVTEEKEEKDRLKTRLHEVILHVLRKRPKLGYFQVLPSVDSENRRTNEFLQGYHDIISVLVLTMAPSESDDLERLESAAEKLSLHRLRDAMGPGLEPLLGMLRWDLYSSLFLLDSCALQVNEATIADCGPRIRQHAKGSGTLAILCAFQCLNRILS